MIYDYLKDISPDLYNIISSPNIDDDRVSQVTSIKTREDLPNFQVTHANSKISIHSMFPSKEAEKLYKSLNYDKNKLTIVFGFGLGYHTDIIIKEHPSRDLVIIEPSYKIIIEALKARCFKHYFTNPKVKIIISTDVSEIAATLENIYNFHIHSGIQTIELPSYNKIFNNEIFAIKDLFLKAIKKFTANMLTVIESGDAYTSNCTHNLRHFNKYPWVSSLFDQFSDTPAIIIGAGPSLSKHFELLKKIQDENLAVLITVDTAYPILTDQGIYPHFVCTADPNPGNFIHFENTDYSKTTLIMEASTYKEIFDLNSSKAFLCSFEGYYTQYALDYLPKRDQKLLSWGSISTTALDLASRMGCPKIIFVGQDLAHTNLQTHCSGSSFDKAIDKQLNSNTRQSLYTSKLSIHVMKLLEKHITPAGDIHNEMTLTQPNLKLYANWLEDRFLELDAEIINATENGILRKHCKQESLQSVYNSLTPYKVNLSSKIQDIYANTKNNYNFKELYKDTLDKINELNLSIEKADELKTHCLSLLQFKDVEGAHLKIRQLFNHIGQKRHCGLEKNLLLSSLLEQQNQKAELFFSNVMKKNIGRKLDGEMVEELANFYYNFFVTKIDALNLLIQSMNTIKESCEVNFQEPQLTKDCI
ncbi:MAG: motility associated factor glycosyltransferase family protein [Candidatus Cloacimonetes bacterium]|nr:motility associated factor glycosyltransferase family protein [Candidatus Cloacimonadota bacterium]